MAPQDRLIVALDYPSREAALPLVDLLGDAVLWYKIGLELYLREGHSIVEELHSRGKKVFLDLKLHDIPNTVAAAVRTASRSGAAMLTVHAAGGPEMLYAAIMAARASAAAIQILGVTVLTSMDRTQLEATGIARSPAEQVLLLGRMALGVGTAGLVCSPEELLAVRGIYGDGPHFVVPGIRGKNDDAGDQRRTASAGEAIRRGATQIVVGRPITQAADSLGAAKAILDEIDSVHRG